MLIFSFHLKSQEIEIITAGYSGDTLFVTYSVEKKTEPDSLMIEVVSYKTRKVYELNFAGDVGNNPGSDGIKKAWAVVSRDSFPDSGESLRIRVKAWMPNNKTKVKSKSNSHMKIFLKKPVNPRFYLSSSVGIVSRSSEFSKIGNKIGFAFNYLPATNFQIGIGAEYFSLKDSIKSFSTAPVFITTRYDLSDNYLPVYFLMDCGYSAENTGPVFSLGIGYKDFIFGPLGVDVNAKYYKFYGDYTFNVLNLNLGLSLSLSSRRKLKKEKVYKFNNYITYAEAGVNYFTEVRPCLSIDLAYNILPFYTQGIGISAESIRYSLKDDFSVVYYSTYYNEFRDYKIPNTSTELNLRIIPVYVGGRLYFSPGKFRPYISWKYGFSLFQSVDIGTIKNGFFSDFGFGFQIKLNKKTALVISNGIKYFNSKYTAEGIENQHFGTVYIKSGIVF